MDFPRLRVVAIWTISAWPALNFVVQNLHEIARRGVRSCVGIAALTLVLGGVGHAIHWFASRRGRGRVAVTAWLALVLLLFGYSTLGQLLELLGDAHGVRVPRMPVWAVLFLLTMGFVIRSRRREKLHFAAVMFCLIVVGVTSLLLIQGIWRFERPRYDEAIEPLAVANKRARLPGLNVYYVILDAYAGRRGLKEATGFDNFEFHERMASRGFVDVSSEKSNYLQTAQTLGGIFALDYPLNADPHSWRNRGALYPEVFEREFPPPLIRRLHDDGYFVWHSGAAWGGCRHRHVRCLALAMEAEHESITQAFLAPTPFGWPRFTLEVVQQGFQSVTSRLPLLLADERPFFIFAHHMGPHPPFMVDAECKSRPFKKNDWNGWYETERPGYLGAVKCVNAQVERLVDSIVRQNPNALIVLQGDHGSAFSVEWEAPMSKWSSQAVRERSSFLNLVRAPHDCRKWLGHPMGQINTARFVLACIEGREPAYLAEHTFLATYSMGTEQGMLMLAPGN